MSDIVFHGIPGSPYLRAALLGCEEKGLACRLEPLSFGAHKSDAYRRLHPFARIPVLEHGDYVLYETQAILRYLEALVPTPALQPTAPRAIGRVNQFVGITDWYFFRNITSKISWERVIVPMLGGTPDLAVINGALDDARLCVAALDELFEGPFLVGDSLTIADLMLAPHVDYFAMTPEGQDILAASPLLPWIERMRRRHSMQATETGRLMAVAA